MLPVVSSLVAVKNAAAQQTNSGFSFVACGDSRPMMYLPVKEGRTDLVELFVEMFGFCRGRRARHRPCCRAFARSLVPVLGMVCLRRSPHRDDRQRLSHDTLVSA
jgi:hypothetical protein